MHRPSGAGVRGSAAPRAPPAPPPRGKPGWEGVRSARVGRPGRAGKSGASSRVRHDAVCQTGVRRLTGCAPGHAARSFAPGRLSARDSPWAGPAREVGWHWSGPALVPHSRRSRRAAGGSGDGQGGWVRRCGGRHRRSATGAAGAGSATAATPRGQGARRPPRGTAAGPAWAPRRRRPHARGRRRHPDRSAGSATAWRGTRASRRCAPRAGPASPQRSQHRQRPQPRVGTIRSEPCVSGRQVSADPNPTAWTHGRTRRPGVVPMARDLDPGTALTGAGASHRRVGPPPRSAEGRSRQPGPSAVVEGGAAAMRVVKWRVRNRTDR